MPTLHLTEFIFGKTNRAAAKPKPNPAMPGLAPSAWSLGRQASVRQFCAAFDLVDLPPSPGPLNGAGG